MINPPKYQLDDGTIQVWRGMPKLPDVIQVMWDTREQNAIKNIQKEREERQRKEDEHIKYAQAHPEEFPSWEQYLQENPELASYLRSGILGNTSKRKSAPFRNLSKEIREMTDAEVADRLEMLRQQKDKILAKEKATEISDKENQNEGDSKLKVP